MGELLENKYNEGTTLADLISQMINRPESVWNRVKWCEYECVVAIAEADLWSNTDIWCTGNLTNQYYPVVDTFEKPC